MPRTILFLNQGTSRVRGSEEALLTLLRGLDRTEFTPIVLCMHPAMRAAVMELGIEAHVFDFPEIMLEIGDWRVPLRRYARSLRRLHAFARERRVDLVFCNGGGPCQMSVPVSRHLGLPLVCLFHHPAPKRYYYLWMVPLAETVIFNSVATAAHAQLKCGKSGQVIHIGIDARGRFAPPAHRDQCLRESLNFGPDDVIFAQLGALVDYKGHHTLIEAFSEVVPALPNAKLLIVGAGPQAESLQARVDEAGLSSRVAFTGFVDDVAPYFRDVIDVNVLASREEGLGLVNLEASAVELPNIASDIPGVRETIVHGQTGYLFPVGDSRALAEHMLRLGRDHELRRAFGENGRRMILEGFTNEIYCARVQDVLRSRMSGLPEMAGLRTA